MYHLIGKDKVAEQHILGKYCNCNSFGATSGLLKVAKMAITHLPLGLSPQNQQIFFFYQKITRALKSS